MRQPWVIAAIALLGVIIVILLVVGLGGGTDQDRLSDEAVAGNSTAPDDPEARCARQATYDLIKRELFRRAAALRGSDQPVFDRLAGYAVLRAEAPILRGEDSQVGSVACSAYVTLDLPPGVAVAGGRRSLSSEIGYAIQPAADGSGEVLTLTSADAIVTPLSTLARVGAPPDQGLEGDGGDPLLEPAPLGDDGPRVVTPPAPGDAPAAPEPAPAAANPSFDCDDASTRGEVAVCADAGLAALDRNMAAEYRRAIAAATPAQRAVLTQTRDRFLAYRDRCPTRGCMADAYLGRMREIRDIMAGRWQGR